MEELNNNGKSQFTNQVIGLKRRVLQNKRGTLSDAKVNRYAHMNKALPVVCLFTLIEV